VMLDEIAEYLDHQGYKVYGTDLFTYEAPDTPDRVALLTSYPGEEPLRVKGMPLPIQERPRMQISNRARNSIVAEQDALLVANLLDGFRGIISGVEYSSIRALQSPHRMPGRDNKNRVWVVCNYAIVKEPSPIF
jgi:hypothetical protein